MPDLGSIHHVNLSISDMQRSVEWYTRVLGFSRGWEMQDTDGRGQKSILLHPSQPLRLVLSLHQANAGEPFSEFRTGLDHIAFAVSTREDVEAWCNVLDSLGVEHSPVKEGATGWLITLRDPDNIQLEIYSESK